MPLVVSRPRQQCAGGLQALAFVDLGVDLAPRATGGEAGRPRPGAKLWSPGITILKRGRPRESTVGSGQFGTRGSAYTGRISARRSPPGGPGPVDRRRIRSIAVERTGAERPAAGRVQVLAGSLGRLKLGIADPE